MRITLRTMAIASASAALVLAAPMSAFAAEAGDVTFSFNVAGATVTNSINNTSGAELGCATSLAPAPGGVLPPVGDVLQNGQTLYANGPAQSGATTQTVTDVPAGSYVVLASCSLTEGDTTTVWISDYPGLDDALAELPWTTHIIEQASTVVAVEGSGSAQTGGLLQYLGAILGSGSAS